MKRPRRKTPRKYTKSKRNYDDPVYRKWRRDVRKRDDRTCQWPGCKCKRGLNVHHILKWATYPSLRFEIGNGITLCKKHHDSIKGREDEFAKMFLDILARKAK